MAIGVAPQRSKTLIFSLNNPEYLYALAYKSALSLGWRITALKQDSFIAFTSFSIRSWGEVITIKIINGKLKVLSACTGIQLTDFGKNRSNIRRLSDTIEHADNHYSEIELIENTIEIEKLIAESINEKNITSPTLRKEKLKGFFSIFIPTEKYFITPIIVNANILVFIAMIMSEVDIFNPTLRHLLDWGANLRVLNLNGQWWRSITACFLHSGIIHLLSNLYAFIYIGLLIEPIIGKSRFITAYILCGLFASTSSIFWYSTTISVGASGAIFGMFGVFLTLLFSNIIGKEARRGLLFSVGIFVSYSILSGINSIGTDNAAHIGGLISGLVIGLIYLPSLKNHQNENLKLTGLTLSFLVVSAGVLGVISTISYRKILPNERSMLHYNPAIFFDDVDDKKNPTIIPEVSSIQQNDELFNRFIIMHGIANSVYNQVYSSKETKLDALEKVGNYYWYEIIDAFTQQSNKLLPENRILRNQNILKYADKKLKYNNLYKKFLLTDDKKYQPVLYKLNDELDIILKEIYEDV